MLDRLGDAVTWPRWWAVDLAFGVLASTTAVVAFIYWILEQRRRPEVRFLWKYSTSGSVDDLAIWEPQHRALIRPGSTLLVEASVLNVGDASADRAMTNFVAPVTFNLLAVTGKPPATPTVVGGAPIAFISQTFDLPPGEWRLQRFKLTSLDTDDQTHLTFKFANSRLNSSGGRLLWSRLVAVQEPEHSWSKPWPSPSAGSETRVAISVSSGRTGSRAPGPRMSTRARALLSSYAGYIMFT